MEEGVGGSGREGGEGGKVDGGEPVAVGLTGTANVDRQALELKRLLIDLFIYLYERVSSTSSRDGP